MFDSEECDLEVGDTIIVSVDDEIESAIVDKINLRTEEKTLAIIRKATSVDIETIERNQGKSKEATKICRDLASEKKLAMKIVDAHFSFDGGKVVFSFISEKRVDFRDLVRNLSKKFQRSIRLQQIGSRDEARGKNGFGVCGRELCCVKFSGSLKSVTTEDARVQQMGQRGSDRLSGLCGRLKCCLGFEAEQYRENLKNMPELGEKFEINGREGRVVDKNIMKSEVVLEFIDKSKEIISVDKLK